MGGAGGVSRVAEGVAVGVGEGVVGHHPVDPKAKVGEPLGGAEHEPGASVGGGGVEHLGLRTPLSSSIMEWQYS